VRAADVNAANEPGPGVPATDDGRLTPDLLLYDDAAVLAVNKPAPLLTQAPPGVPSLEARVKAFLKARHPTPGDVYLGVPHRLDRPVTGVIVFARTPKAAGHVHKQFEAHTVRKVYWAVVAGDVTPDAGVWDDWVRKVPDQPRTERAAEGEPGAKLAMLEYRVVRRVGGRTLVEFEPLTGRMHQLRVQAAWRDHPVLGDLDYGATAPFGPPAVLPRDRVIALHARRLTLTHPTTNRPLTLEAPLPDYWTVVVG
jgi:23S rRNA pseudouridine1911/1915/1917 synthase